MGEPGSPTPPPAGAFGRTQPLRRGVGKPGFHIPPPAGEPRPHAGAWGNRVSPYPRPPPAGGSGRAKPSQENLVIPLRMRAGGPRTRAPPPGRVWEGAALPRSMFIPSGCDGAAWTAEVTIVRSVLPPSQPPPAGGRRRVPAPGGGGSGRGPAPCPRSRGAGVPPALPGHVHRARCAPRMGPDVTMGEPGSPTPPPAGAFGRTQPLRRGVGKPGFPTPGSKGSGLADSLLNNRIRSPDPAPWPRRAGPGRATSTCTAPRCWPDRPDARCSRRSAETAPRAGPPRRGRPGPSRR